MPIPDNSFTQSVARDFTIRNNITQFVACVLTIPVNFTSSVAHVFAIPDSFTQCVARVFAVAVFLAREAPPVAIPTDSWRASTSAQTLLL